MAQTWPLRKWKLALLGAIDAVARPVAWLVGSRAPLPPVNGPANILVSELWQIGDVVLVTPFLRAVRECFPTARITLLGKPHADELLKGSGLVDDVIVLDVPWTRTSGKYNPGAYDWRLFVDTIGLLRRRKFDLAFDARMDLRSNILLALSGARRRVGFAYGGGDWLLTDAVAVDPGMNHKADDWLSLLQAVGCPRRSGVACSLTLSAGESDAAREFIFARFGAGPPPIALHPGASHAGKRWPLENFAHLARGLSVDGHRLLALEDPSGYGHALSGIAGVVSVRCSLREMMALISQCALLVCNDSGPMHVAAALGVPVVAMFERGEPRWFGPVGPAHTVLLGERGGVDVYADAIDEPPRKPVAVSRVRDAVEARLALRPSQSISN